MCILHYRSQGLPEDVNIILGSRFISILPNFPLLNRESHSDLPAEDMLFFIQIGIYTDLLNIYLGGTPVHGRKGE